MRKVCPSHYSLLSLVIRSNCYSFLCFLASSFRTWLSLKCEQIFKERLPYITKYAA